MQLVTPVLKNVKELVYAENQLEYISLSVITDNVNNLRLSRFSFSEEEKAAIAAGADLFICIHANHQPPINLNINTGEDSKQVLNLFGLELPDYKFFKG
jgi:hypothetical protein